MIMIIKQSTQSSFCIFDANLQAPIRFLDAIASLDWGYESLSVCLSVCVIKPNNGYIAKHGAIIEYTLNVY